MSEFYGRTSLLHCVEYDCVCHVELYWGSEIQRIIDLVRCVAWPSRREVIYCAKSMSYDMCGKWGQDYSSLSKVKCPKWLGFCVIYVPRNFYSIFTNLCYATIKQIRECFGGRYEQGFEHPENASDPDNHKYRKEMILLKLHHTASTTLLPSGINNYACWVHALCTVGEGVFSAQ